MKTPFLDTAIVKALRRDATVKPSALRVELGCTTAQFDDAVQRLRWAGKLVFGRRFALSPSMLKDSPSAGPLPTPADDAKGAGNARREDQAVPCSAGPTLPGPSVSDQVKAEASDKGQRRSLARKISTGLTPLPRAETIADKFRRLAEEVDSEEAEALAEAEAVERRDRDLDRLPTPSAVLRRAKRDWPQQCADVQALAKELGVSLGEAWRRTIAAGVDCMRAGDDGEAMA